MKNNLTFQLSPVTNRTITEQDHFPVIGMVNTISGYADKYLPGRISFVSVSTVKKSYVREEGLNPVSNVPMKQVATRLSEIEMALDCYNVSQLQFSTMELKDMFQDKRMPAVYKLAAQMEKLAGENRFQEIKDLLREVKKIIGWIVNHRKQSMD